MMLSSRPTTQSNDIRDAIAASSAVVNIIEDTTVNPPSFSLALELTPGCKLVPLLVKNADQSVSVFDLMTALNRLGFSVDYQEIR